MRSHVRAVRMHQYYMQEVVPVLQQRFGYRNVMQVPRYKDRLEYGIGGGHSESQAPRCWRGTACCYPGQKRYYKSAQIYCCAKLRTGMSIGVKVTLRKDRMYDFFDRLVNIALPRVRDFRGVTSNAFDGRGNYTLGVEEQVIFPRLTTTRWSVLKDWRLLL